MPGTHRKLRFREVPILHPPPLTAGLLFKYFHSGHSQSSFHSACSCTCARQSRRRLRLLPSECPALIGNSVSVRCRSFIRRRSRRDCSLNTSTVGIRNPRFTRLAHVRALGNPVADFVCCRLNARHSSETPFPRGADPSSAAAHGGIALA